MSTSGTGDAFGFPPPRHPAEGSGDGTGAPPYAQTANLDYASFWKRAGAVILDSIAILLVFALGAAIVAALYFGLNLVSEALAAAVAVFLGVALYIGSLVWFMLLEASPYGQTPGKRLLNIRVVDTRGQTISKGSAVGRYFAKIISYLPLYLGYLWPLWDKERRTFHDMILDTRVVKVSDAPPLRAVVTAPFRRRNAAAG